MRRLQLGDENRCDHTLARRPHRRLRHAHTGHPTCEPRRRTATWWRRRMTRLADAAGPKDHLADEIARVHVEGGVAPDDHLQTAAEEDADPRPLLALLRWACRAPASAGALVARPMRHLARGRSCTIVSPGSMREIERHSASKSTCSRKPRNPRACVCACGWKIQGCEQQQDRVTIPGNRISPRQLTAPRR